MSGAIVWKRRSTLSSAQRRWSSSSSSLRLMAAKPWPPTVIDFSAEVDVDIRPAREPAAHVVGHHGIGVADAAKRLIGKYDAETKGVACGVAFPEGDVV